MVETIQPVTLGVNFGWSFLFTFVNQSHHGWQVGQLSTVTKDWSYSTRQWHFWRLWTMHQGLSICHGFVGCTYVKGTFFSFVYSKSFNIKITDQTWSNAYLDIEIQNWQICLLSWSFWSSWFQSIDPPGSTVPVFFIQPRSSFFLGLSLLGPQGSTVFLACLYTLACI